MKFWTPSNPLSVREIACLAFIAEGAEPTLREIGLHLGVSKSQADQVIMLLRRRKLLKRGDERSRGSRSGALILVGSAT